MRKSGWAAATGLGSLVMLLAACGGSSTSSTSATGTVYGPAQATVAATPHSSAGPQPSSGGVSFPPVGTTVLVVQKSNLGYLLAEANGQVLYTYGKDTKGGAPTCTGSCATTWPPATGTPKAGPADTFPGTFGVIKGSGGVEQITYEGMPLYTFAGAKVMTTKGNGLDGEWHVVPLSESDISSS